MSASNISSYVSYNSKLLERRRFLHAHAELSFQEYETSAYIASILSSFPGIEVTHPTKTSVVGILRGQKGTGRTVAFRADIDALPIEESNDVPFRSLHPGVMHACGHDGHTAMLLTAAEILAQQRSELCGEVRFIFQHAEEQPPGGAEELYRAGIMDGVDELYGLHLSSSFPSGKFGVRSGVLTAATDKALIIIHGKGGHSALPQQCIDPVVVGAELILALQTLISRRIPPAESAILSVCCVKAGESYNVIPDIMTLMCSVRTFHPDIRELLHTLIEDTASGICAAFGATSEVRYEYGYSNVINDEVLTAAATDLIIQTFGEDHYLSIEPVTPGEDFSALSKNCPAFFVELGTQNPLKPGTENAHHQSCYMMDEDALLYGCTYITELLKLRTHP